MTLDPRQGALTVSYYGHMRAAGVDRERAVDVLRAGFAEGRLTKEEFDERAGRAYASRTYAELAVLTADLPAGPLGALNPGYYGVRPAHRRTNGLAIAAFVCAFFPGPLSIAAVALGIVAHAQIRERGDAGGGLATAAIVIGGFFTVMLAILLSQF